MSIQQWWQRGPKLGTPQNPEIIEPGQTPRQSSSGRLHLVLGLLRTMLMVSIPAAALDSACIWLWAQTGHEGGSLAVLMLLVLALPTFALNFMALIANIFLLFALGAGLSGRRAEFPRFVSFSGRL